MSKPTFDETEQFLLESWNRALALEGAMDLVRQQYVGVGERIIERAGTLDEVFDHCDNGVGKNKQSGGYFAFGKRRWVKNDNDWVVGLWLCYIGLNSLVSEETEPPYAIIWGPRFFETREDAAAVLKALTPKLQEVVPAGQKVKLEYDEGSRQNLVWWEFSSKQELLAALREGSSSKFEEIILAQARIFTEMLELIEPILLRASGRNG